MPRNSRKNRERKQTIVNKNILKKLLFIFLAVILLIIFLFIYKLIQQNIKKNNISLYTENNVKQIFTQEDYNSIEGDKYTQEETKINIIALGNILYNHELYEGLYEDNSGTYLFADFLYNIIQSIEPSDYKIANLGVNFTADYKIADKKTNSPRELIFALKNIGINFLNTANQNSNDEGTEGIIKTLETLDEQKIIHTGTARAEIEKQIPTIENIKGLNIAFLSYTENLNKELNKKNSYMVNMLNKETIVEDIKKAKEKGAEFIIVNLNWGNIKTNEVTKKQKEISKYIADNGADLILGNNNNGIIQEVEIYKNNEEKNVAIAYSIGNFIGKNNSKIEIALDIQLAKDLENKTRITKVNFNPMYLLDKGKEAEERFLLVDVNKEIERYEQGFPKNINDDEYKKIIDELEKTEKILNGGIK